MPLTLRSQPVRAARYRPEVTEPEDFDDFWRQTIDEARGHDLIASERKIDNKFALVDTYDRRSPGSTATR